MRADRVDRGLMLHWLSTAISTYVLHPEHGNGYQWHSGIGSDVQELAIFGVIIAHVKHRNCHHKGCWRSWPFVHIHPEHGWPSCKHHWDETPDHISKPKLES